VQGRIARRLRDLHLHRQQFGAGREAEGANGCSAPIGCCARLSAEPEKDHNRPIEIRHRPGTQHSHSPTQPNSRDGGHLVDRQPTGWRSPFSSSGATGIRNAGAFVGSDVTGHTTTESLA
jgi:hypothetical protein